MLVLICLSRAWLQFIWDVTYVNAMLERKKKWHKTWWILNYSGHLINTLSPKLDKVSYVSINPDKTEPQKSHDYRDINVFKKVCSQKVL